MNSLNVTRNAEIGFLSRPELREVRAYIWQTYGLRLRYVCRTREACTWCLKRNTGGKAGRVNGACNIVAKVRLVSEALYWGSVYSVKKGGKS